MERLKVLKTYKIYINGKFPRTESGRFYELKSGNKMIANVCLASRKDFRNAVEAARKSQESWSTRSAFNRSQIIYRIAEMMESRRSQFMDELVQLGSSKEAAIQEIHDSVDRLVHYAGWCDKYQQIFSSVNPVASSHFNFSVLEPQGVVAMIQNDNNSLLGMINQIIPCIVGGNTCVFLANENKPLTAISFAEVLENSDVPAGVINILTGKTDELLPHFSTHMDVNCISYFGRDEDLIQSIKSEANINVKRVIVERNTEAKSDYFETPYHIKNYQEVKTTWHPIEQISPSGAKY